LLKAFDVDLALPHTMWQASFWNTQFESISLPLKGSTWGCIAINFVTPTTSEFIASKAAFEVRYTSEGSQ